MPKPIIDPTPGPWEVRRDDTAGIFVYTPRGLYCNRPVAIWSSPLYLWRVADTLLIVAAPELLAAAEQLLGALADRFTSDDLGPEVLRAEGELRAAVRRARTGGCFSTLSHGAMAATVAAPPPPDHSTMSLVSTNRRQSTTKGEQ